MQFLVPLILFLLEHIYGEQFFFLYKIVRKLYNNISDWARVNLRSMLLAYVYTHILPTAANVMHLYHISLFHSNSRWCSGFMCSLSNSARGPLISLTFRLYNRISLPSFFLQKMFTFHSLSSRFGKSER